MKMSAQTLIKVGVLLAVFLLAALGSYYTTKNGLNFLPGRQDAPLAEGTAPTREFYKAVEDQTFQEVKEKAPEVVTNPNISSADIKDEVKKTLDRKTEPENYFITFDGTQLSNVEMVIIQGDYVTWLNRSNSIMQIDGADDWGTTLDVAPGDAFTQGFDFKGEYPYSISGTDVSGVVKVLSPSEIEEDAQ